MSFATGFLFLVNRVEDVMARMRAPEAARFLGVSVRSLRDSAWRRRHGIPHYKVGSAVVFDPAELELWLLHCEHFGEDMRAEANLLVSGLLSRVL